MFVTRRNALNRLVSFVIALGFAVPLTVVVIQQASGLGVRVAGLLFVWGIVVMAGVSYCRGAVWLARNKKYRPYTSRWLSARNSPGLQKFCLIRGEEDGVAVLRVRLAKSWALLLRSPPKRRFIILARMNVAGGIGDWREFRVNDHAGDMDSSVLELDWRFDTPVWKAELEIDIDPEGEVVRCGQLLHFQLLLSRGMEIEQEY